MECARQLAEAEGAAPFGVTPDWGKASDFANGDQGAAVDGDPYGLRDSEIPMRPPSTVSPEAFRHDRWGPSVRQVLLVIQVAASIVGLLAALAYVMNASQSQVAWNAFQP